MDGYCGQGNWSYLGMSRGAPTPTHRLTALSGLSRSKREFIKLEKESGGGADLSNPVMCIFEILDTSKQYIVKSVCLGCSSRVKKLVQDPGQIFTTRTKYLLNEKGKSKITYYICERHFVLHPYTRLFHVNSTEL